ncbi:MAG TPA: hypothetical protein VFH45_11585, partial [Acidimicrobiales bacterium]|nr:hypothetical protein [Acidimicrobiales bacterium]
MPIRVRLALLFALGTAALVSVGGTVFVRALSRSLNTSVLTGLQARAVAIAEDVFVGGPGIPIPANRSGPAGLIEQDEVAQVVDPRGLVLGDSGPRARQVLVTPAELTRASHRQVVVTRSVPGFDSPLLLLAVPVGDPNHLVVVTGRTLDTAESAVDRVETALFIG